jgi:hypothetical protein
MKVVFKTTCVTTFGKYVKGRTYDLDDKEAKQFIKEGLADAVKVPVKKTTRKTK